MNISTILDLSIIVLASMFLVDVLAFGYGSLGLSESIIPVPYELKFLFDFLIWPLVLLLILDLTLKYRKINDPKKFVKKYWVDIFMLILIPIFSAFKFFKIGLNVVKKLKTVKMGTKIIHKTKKITNNKS